MNKYPKNLYLGNLTNNRYTIVKKQKSLLAFLNYNNYYIYKSLISKRKFLKRNFIEIDSLNNLLISGYMSNEEIQKLIINYLNSQTNNEENKNKVLRKLGIKNDRY